MKRTEYLPGLNARIHETPNGVIVSGRAADEWAHPWSLTVQREEGEWRAYVLPGFVNLKDAHIAMPKDWPSKGAEARDVPLTDEPEPYLVLNEWRDAIRGTGAGYPEYFVKLGVKPLEREKDSDPARDRELRAIDVVLSQPRTGSRLDVRLGQPVLDAQTQFLDTVFVKEYALSVGGRARLKAIARWVAPEEQPIAGVFGTLLNAGDQQFDEIHLSTVWMLSPPGAVEDDEPDDTWEAYEEYSVYWNLKHATKVMPPEIKPDSLQLLVPLAGGVAQPVINTLLAFINDQNEEARAFLNGADARGRFWT